MRQEVVPFDLETTGLDVYHDRTVTAFIGVMDSYGTWMRQKHWLVNSGRNIPEAASNVHGITNERAEAEGCNPVPYLRTLHSIFRKEVIEGRKPLVVYNAPYDLTMINAEFERVGLEPIAWWSEGAWIMDPLVIDKAIDKYRKGGRKLVDTAKVYGVPVEANAHDASADCLMAGRITLAILNSPMYAAKDAQWWMESQREWKAEANDHYESFRRGHEKKKPPADKLDPAFVVERGWPVYDRP